MGSISALLFTALSFYIPWLYAPIRRDRSLLFSCWTVLAFRHALAVVNAFITPLSTSWGDLYRFHNIGAGASAESQLYGLLLRTFYKVFGVSFWLGEVLSIVVFSLSLLVFVQLCQRLAVQENLVPGVWLYGLMLSPAMHASVTLRESYQALAFLGMVASLIELRLRQSQSQWAIFAGSALLLIYMHQGMAIYVAGVLCFGLPWAVQGLGRLGWFVALACLLLAPVVGPRVLESFQDQSATARAFSEGRLMDYATNYRENLNESRSDYGLTIDDSSVPAFLGTSLGVFCMYFVAPLPWQITSGIDYYAFFENWVRLTLMAGACWYGLRARPEVRSRILFILAMALSLEAIWAMGTANWGTALRHHVVAWPAFVAAGIGANPFRSLDPQWAQLQRRRARRHALESAGPS